MTVEEWKRKNPPIQRKPLTNADRIRSMTDEELADYLTDICDPYLLECGGWLGWLREEAGSEE